MEIKIVLWLLFSHWIADFVLQSDYQAKNKSDNFLVLLMHCSEYSVVILFGWVVYQLCFRIEYVLLYVIYFGIINFGMHLLIDFFTSKINKRLYLKNRHYFFVSIGFDQFLHYVILLLSYKLLMS